MIRGYMKLRVVRNHTLKSDIICMSLDDTSIEYVYAREFEEKKWSNKHDIQVLINDIDVEIGGDLSIYLEHKK